MFFHIFTSRNRSRIVSVVRGLRCCTNESHRRKMIRYIDKGSPLRQYAISQLNSIIFSSPAHARESDFICRTLVSNWLVSGLSGALLSAGVGGVSAVSHAPCVAARARWRCCVLRSRTAASSNEPRVRFFFVSKTNTASPLNSLCATSLIYT